MIDFQTWLADRSIDCQQLTPELQAALQSQYEAEFEPRELISPAEVLVVPIDSCQWPQRSFWLSTVQ